MAKLSYKVSYYVLYVMFAAILVVLGLFYFGGDAQGDAVLMSVDSEMWQPAQTDALLFLMYGLFGIAVVATVAAFLFQFGTALKDNPGNALKSLIGVIVLVAVVVIAWAMGRDDRRRAATAADGPFLRRNGNRRPGVVSRHQIYIR